jgi:hypothetical protein
VSFYVLALLVTAILCFLAVMVLAGPHGGLFPRSFEQPILVAGWIVLLALPAYLTRIVVKRMPKSRPRG